MKQVLRLSNSPFKTTKSDNLADTKSASLLLQAGYIRQEVAGVFHYLPLWLRVLNNVRNIIWKHLDDFWAEEILMSWIWSKEHWEQTWRQDMDVLYNLPSSEGKYNFLNPTHEEIITPLMKEFLQSYRDLPALVYQTQTKFRNEKRPKSGILRWREFLMNDTYSFHQNTEDLDKIYDQMVEVYKNIFDELGIGKDTFFTYALWGTFSKYSHEFQTLTDTGEDTIYVDKEKGIAVNKEVLETEEGRRDFADYTFEEYKASEVGNIFKLWTKFSGAFWSQYVDNTWAVQDIIMWCYGIGVSRTMGIIADKFYDEKGLVWPENVAPYDYYLILLWDDDATQNKLEEIISEVKKSGKSIIIDDRKANFGAKANDADLLGIPHRLVLSKKSLENWGIEYKKRTESESRFIANISDI